MLVDSVDDTIKEPTLVNKLLELSEDVDDLSVGNICFIIIFQHNILVGIMEFS